MSNTVFQHCFNVSQLFRRNLTELRQSVCGYNFNYITPKFLFNPSSRLIHVFAEVNGREFLCSVNL